MRTTLAAPLILVLLGGCTTLRPPASVSDPVAVQILAINDFHGALEPPGMSVSIPHADGTITRVPAGGAAYLASAVASLRASRPNTITVAAGDLTGASPFVSSQFLDEPAVLALNAIGLEVNAVGNHEFDRGVPELQRLQTGGCAKHTAMEPCRVDAGFPGARYRYLAANVRTASGGTLFPGTYLRRFGTGAAQVTVGFVGLTLRSTPTLVEPGAVAALRFEDEAQTINAAVPRLRAEGADAIVVLIHQGVATISGYDGPGCEGVTGDLIPIIERLDAGVDVVVSGHTHNAYICEFARGGGARPLLVTSAGSRGMLVTDIALSIDAVADRVVAARASNVIVQGAPYDGPAGEVPTVPAFRAFAPEPGVAALVSRYVAAAEPIARRRVGRLTAPAERSRNASGESMLGSLVADAQLRATGADIAFMNSFGLRADLVPGPDGAVTYGQLYAVQPFANVLQVKRMTGAQIKAVLEQQFASGSNTAERPNMLQVSRGFAFRYDLRRPAGDRVVAITLDGQPLDPARSYRVGLSNFLAAGGDNFTAFVDGEDVAGGGGNDLDALEAYVAASGALTPPAPGRIVREDAPAVPSSGD